MSRAYDFTVAGVLTIFAGIIHRVSVELFDVDTPLYGVATDGTANLSGGEFAALVSEFLILWLPLLIFGFAWTYAMIKEYRRQSLTARRQVGP